LHAVRNCRIGRAEVDDEHGLTVGELLFDWPISRGETHLIEYSLTNAVRRTRNAATRTTANSAGRSAIPAGSPVRRWDDPGDEWDGPLHGFRDAVACFPDTEDVLDIEERDLDGPAGRVAGDDLRRCGGEVGGDQCDVVSVGGAGFGGSSGVGDEDDRYGVGAPRAEPQAHSFGDLHGAGGAVAGYRDGFPGRGRGDVGRCADSCAFQRWSTPFPGPGWGELREHGVDFGSGVIVMPSPRPANAPQP
jgi:hypothetical protein